MKKGDYFYTSWGYDQTNIDYLIIISMSPAGKTATCKMVSPITLGGSGTSEVLTPGTAHGESFSMRVRRNGTLRGSYPYCNGGKRLDSFLPVKLGDEGYQTLPQFGH